MGLLEKYEIKEEGYHPFLITEGWQIAQLNADENQKVENIKRLDIHQNTDEAFFLIKGKVVLITASINNNLTTFQFELMKPGITYNIPAKTWHNIAMYEQSEVIIIEKNNTHINDYEYFNISKEKQYELVEEVHKLYNKQI